MDMERSIEFLIESAARCEALAQDTVDMIEVNMTRVVSSYGAIARNCDAVLDSHRRIQQRIEELLNGHDA